MKLKRMVPAMPMVAAIATATDGSLPDMMPSAMAGKATKLRSAGMEPPGVTMAI
ncbi:hypothetical protein D3C84_319480 [compost metagenome]